MTVEISGDTHRLLRQLAMMQGITADEVAERVLDAFCRDVFLSAAMKLQEDLDGLLSNGEESGIR